MGALMKWLQSEPAAGTANLPLHSIDELRRRSLDLLADCDRPHGERIRGQVARAHTAQQIWEARCDMYQTIARQHCEAEAVRRLNQLLPAFEGWLPPGALRPL